MQRPSVFFAVLTFFAIQKNPGAAGTLNVNSYGKNFTVLFLRLSLQQHQLLKQAQMPGVLFLPPF